MKRPLAVTGFVFLAALAVALFLGQEWFPALGAVCLSGLALSLKSKRLRQNTAAPLVFAVSLAAVVFLSVYNGIMIQPSVGMRGKNAVITGEICELPYENYGRYYYTVNAGEIMSSDGTLLTNTKVMISSDQKIDAEPFDIIKGEAEFYDNVSSYNMARGIHLSGYFTSSDDIEAEKNDSKPFYYYCLMTRCYLSERIHSILPEKQAAFVTAFLTGDKSGISDEVASELRGAGLSHIIVVSGFHLSVITQLIMMLLMFLLRGRKRTAAVISIAVLFLYMSVTGYPPSVMRSGIMQIVMLLGILLYREADSLTSLGLSVLIMTLSDPYAAGDIGLLLSYSATLGILLLSPKITEYLQISIIPFVEKRTDSLKRLLVCGSKGIIDSFAVALSAYVFTLPVLIMYFREIAVYSVLSNIIAAAIIPLMISSAFIMLLLDLSFVLSFIAVPVGYFSAVLTEFICGIAGFMSDLPFALLNVSQGYVPIWLTCMMILAAALYFLKNIRHRVSIFVFAALLSFAAGSALTGLFNQDITRIAVLDTGDGISAVITENDSTIILSCGGDTSKTKIIHDYLKAIRTEKISFMLLTDNRKKTSYYADRLLDDFDVNMLEVYDEDKFYDIYRTAFAKAKKKLSHISEKNPFNRVVTGSKRIESISDGDERAVFADINGLKLLICSDRTDCELLPDEWKNADFLIINGMVFHTAVIDYSTMIISDKTENEQTYRLLKNRDNIYRTYSGGNVIIRADKNKNCEIRRDELWQS